MRKMRTTVLRPSTNAGGSPTNPANLQVLCQSCHSRKTRRARGYIRKKARIDALTRLRYLLALFLTGCLVQPAAAASETVNVKHYGDCWVGDYIGYGGSSYSTGPILVCGQKYGRLIYFSDGTVRLEVGLQFNMAEMIMVRVQVYPDYKPVTHGLHKWSATGNYATLGVYSTRGSDGLLDQLAAGQKLVLELGTESTAIDLTGSARAIADFRRR